VWKAPAMTQVYAQLAANKLRSTTTVAVIHNFCHFGHPLIKKPTARTLC
jgi:hypothetical protein